MQERMVCSGRIHVCVSMCREGDVCRGLCMSTWVMCVTVTEGAGVSTRVTECEDKCGGHAYGENVCLAHGVCLGMCVTT